MCVFTPDYAIPPGATLRETLADQGVTQVAAARSLRLTPHGFRLLLLGKTPVTPVLSRRLAQLTAVPALFWLRAQAAYQSRRFLSVAFGQSAPLASNKSLARPTGVTQVTPNIRAVPLVRKNDAHQGRVSFLPKFEALPGTPTP